MTSGETCVNVHSQVVWSFGFLETEVPYQTLSARQIPDKPLELFNSGFGRGREETTKFLGRNGALWTIHGKVVRSSSKRPKEGSFRGCENFTFGFKFQSFGPPNTNSISYNICLNKLNEIDKLSS